MATLSSADGSATSAGSSNRMLGTSRRRACNECKQQKLKCLPASTDGCAPCSRCQRLGIECRMDSGFRRTRKRSRRSHELENEVNSLRRQLAVYRANTQQLDVQVTPTTAALVDDNQISISPRLSASTSHSTPNMGLNVANPLASVYERHASSYMVDRARAPGLTTQPVIDVPQTPAVPLVVTPRPRRIEDIELTVEEIEELFNIYFSHYHPFLPFLTPGKSPHAYYESSRLLFWSIISVASRRFASRPTLLSGLAQSVTELLWGSLRSVPYTLQAVQGLLIISTWPFPTNSSTADPTYMFSGIMVQLGAQMGLHRAFHAEDFTKIPLRLTADEHGEWMRTWEACNIVARSVSVGCGLPATVPSHDWMGIVSPGQGASYPQEMALKMHLRIEQFRHRVSLALAPEGSQSMPDRLSLYSLLNAVYEDLLRDISSNTPMAHNTDPLAMTRIYLLAARLHLHSFYLFDEPALHGYTGRILTLYQSAYDFITQTLEVDSDGSLFHYWPFFYYQVFVAASFIVLKISTSVSVASLIDVQSAKQLLNSAISALRKMSVANNDLPARLSDVIAFFYSDQNYQSPSGESVNSLRLHVRNRLSMSVVYDSLWKWRKYFHRDIEGSGPAGESNHPDIEGDHLDIADLITFDWPYDLDIPESTPT